MQALQKPSIGMHLYQREEREDKERSDGTKSKACAMCMQCMQRKNEHILPHSSYGSKFITLAAKRWVLTVPALTHSYFPTLAMGLNSLL